MQRILAAQPLHPEKVTYYLERRDPDFDAKMREVLLVYQEVALQNEGSGGIQPTQFGNPGGCHRSLLARYCEALAL